MFTKTLLTVHLITLIFLVTTLRPLIRVSEKRVALFIVVSKTLGSFVKLHFDLMLAALNYFGDCNYNVCTNDFPLWYEKFYVGYTQTMVISLYGHILALALNRFIGIYFPFEYKHYMSKRRILLYCSAIWFLSICLSIFYIFFEFRNWIVYLSGICLVASIGSYLLISIKLLQFKYCRPNIRNLRAEQRDERNPIRISIICFLSLLFGIVYLAIPIFQSNLLEWSKLRGLGVFLYWMMMIVVYDLIFCSDELCLFIMIGDLRSNFWLQFKWIYKPLWQFCCNIFECLFPFCVEWWHRRNQNRIVPLNNNRVNPVANNNQSNNLTTNNNNNNNNISNGTIAVLKSKKDEMAITLLFTVISLAYYLTFIVALLTSVPYKSSKDDIHCPGNIEGYSCLLNKDGCPRNGSTERPYWSDCDLFMPWLSGKQLGCRQRLYSEVSICFTFGPINYGSKYLCCPDLRENNSSKVDNL